MLAEMITLVGLRGSVWLEGLVDCKQLSFRTTPSRLDSFDELRFDAFDETITQQFPHSRRVVVLFKSFTASIALEEMEHVAVVLVSGQAIVQNSRL